MVVFLFISLSVTLRLRWRSRRAHLSGLDSKSECCCLPVTHLQGWLSSAADVAETASGTASHEVFDMDTDYICWFIAGWFGLLVGGPACPPLTGKNNVCLFFLCSFLLAGLHLSAVQQTLDSDYSILILSCIVFRPDLLGDLVVSCGFSSTLATLEVICTIINRKNIQWQ